MVRPLRLVRFEDGVIAGICSGLGEAFEIKPGILRILLIGSALFLGTGIGIYIFLWIALPRRDRLDKAYDNRVLGVCAALARKFDQEVGLIRFLALLSVLVSFGTAFFVYVILYFLLPANSPVDRLTTQ